MNTRTFLLAFLLAAPAVAQETAPDQTTPDPVASEAAAAIEPVVAQEPVGVPASFSSAAQDLRAQLDASVAELVALREQMAAEQIPQNERLGELQAELIEVRGEFARTTRQLDGSTLDLSNLSSEIKRRQDEVTYLSNLLGEYIRNFESRLHIAELQRYETELEEASLAPENTNLSTEEVFLAQAQLLNLSLGRLEDALGGTRFKGSAVDATGLVRDGTFALVGPAGLFLPDAGDVAGTAEQRLGSLEPAMLPFGNPEDGLAAAKLVSTGSGFFPADTTLGNALKVEATKETFLEHVQKGGPVMYPIFTLAGAALLVALLKWLSMAFIRRPSRKRVEALLEAVAEGDEEAAVARVRDIKGPVGKMLSKGVEHIRQPRELIEEVMYETVLTTKLKLQSFLPFVAIAAASAPLLGLLGTVTGIINTFKLLTVFGSGDVKSLSGGISEALITTKFGLIVAIPSLLLHAFLARKAKGVVDTMEKNALAFVNEVGKRPVEVPVSYITRAEPGAGAEGSAEPAGRAAATPDPELVRLQVREILNDLLVPLAEDSSGDPR